MKPGTTSRPFTSMIDPFLPISRLLPTATIRLPSILTASAHGCLASPVQIFPLVRITAANSVSIRGILSKDGERSVLAHDAHQISRFGGCAASVGPSLIAMPCDETQNELIDLARDLRKAPGGRVWIAIEPRGNPRGHVVAFERHRSGEQFVQHRAGRVEVGSGVEFLPEELLGAHVVGRSDDRLRHGVIGPLRIETLRDSEIENLHTAVG